MKIPQWNLTFALGITRSLVLGVVLVPVLGYCQSATPSKQVQHATGAWYSINTTTRISDYWGTMADFHLRTSDFMASNYFYFLRVGGVYWIRQKYPIAGGVAHLWLAPAAGNSTWSDENRIYQQFSSIQVFDKLSLLHRVRVEERWRDNIVNDQKVGPKQFSVRLRYLAGLEFRVFKNDRLPKLVLSDEVLVQFGQSIVYNSFDQNRLFLGIKFPITNRLLCDTGYMNILQQQSTGSDYAASNIFRFFLYYYMDRRNSISEALGDNGE